MTAQIIKLNFINKSKDKNERTVVIFQKNIAEKIDKTAVAWTVIKNPRFHVQYSFLYPLRFKIRASDPYGNLSRTITACNGQSFEMITDNAGYTLRLSNTPATSKTEVEIKNSLGAGKINGYALKNEKVLATKTNIAPKQKASFQFRPTIWVGIVPKIIEEGGIMNSAITRSINREIPLENITRADIVMTGGGSCKTSSPFIFSLEKRWWSKHDLHSFHFQPRKRE